MPYYESGYARVDDDHYPTIDPRLVDQLARNFNLSGIIWEPCPGSGELSQQFAAHGAIVKTTTRDFYAIDRAPDGITALITNPPYLSKGRNAGRFIAHALDLCQDAWVVVLVRWAWLGGAGTVSGKADLVAHPRFHALTLPDCRPIWNRSGKANPIHAFTWLVWAPARIIKPKQPLVWL